MWRMNCRKTPKLTSWKTLMRGWVDQVWALLEPEVASVELSVSGHDPRPALGMRQTHVNCQERARKNTPRSFHCNSESAANANIPSIDTVPWFCQAVSMIALSSLLSSDLVSHSSTTQEKRTTIFRHGKRKFAASLVPQSARC